MTGFTKVINWHNEHRQHDVKLAGDIIADILSSSTTDGIEATSSDMREMCRMGKVQELKVL